MKTMITFILICMTTITMGQNATQQENTVISEEKLVELKEVLQKLSTKLEKLQEQDVLITKADMKILKLKLSEAMVKLDHSMDLQESVYITTDNGEKVKVAYSFKINPQDDNTVDAIQDVNFVAIGDTLTDVLKELQESPKLKELADRMNELEKKYELRETKN